MPSGLSSLPPVSVVPSIRPVTSILPAGQQAAASPFLAPAIAQQVKAAAALFELGHPGAQAHAEPPSTYPDPALLNRFGALGADAATRKAAERPAVRRPPPRDAEAARRQIRLYGAQRLPGEPPPVDLEA